MINFINMLKDDSGAAAAEYALILAVIGLAVVGAAAGLGTAIAGAMTNATAAING
jgi:pilus assembly protein Flp/PilA